MAETNAILKQRVEELEAQLTECINANAENIKTINVLNKDLDGANGRILEKDAQIKRIIETVAQVLTGQEAILEVGRKALQYAIKGESKHGN